MSVDAKTFRSILGSKMVRDQGRLYALTGHRAHVWLAWSTARRMRVPPPVWLLEALDRIASDLLAARSQRDAIAAVGFGGKGPGPYSGRPGKPSKVDTWGRDVYLHAAVAELLANGFTLDEAAEKIACQPDADEPDERPPQMRLSDSTIRNAYTRVQGALQKYQRDSSLRSNTT